MIMNPTIKSWLSMSREELDEIYKSAEAGTIPGTRRLCLFAAYSAGGQYGSWASM